MLDEQDVGDRDRHVAPIATHPELTAGVGTAAPGFPIEDQACGALRAIDVTGHRARLYRQHWLQLLAGHVVELEQCHVQGKA
eukprot:scaffold40293_cov63-Phaeocystis_antarctica.AAC.1